MCLVSPTKYPYVAPEDLFCYKVLNEIDGKLKTPYTHFFVELNKLYTNDDVSRVNKNVITSGFFHAYTSPSYMYKRRAYYSNLYSAQPAMYLAVIPKGTKFFVNNNCTEICATAIKIIKKIVNIEEDMPFTTVAIDLKEQIVKQSNVNKTFDTYKESLTTIENIVKFAKDNNLYEDIVRKYETFEEGSYEKNLYAYRLIIAVLTENEKNSLIEGKCYYPYVDFYTGKDVWHPTSDKVKIGTIISGGTSYIVIGNCELLSSSKGLGFFDSHIGVSCSITGNSFWVVSQQDIAEFISRHFGRLIFDLKYGCSNCDYYWVDEE